MNEKHNIRNIQELQNPQNYGLEPLQPLDTENIDNFDDMLTAMSKTSFGGRQLGEALDVLQAMIQDQDCLVVGTFSGAMTVAKMGKILCTMLDKGWLNIIVSTGALMAHGFIESMGMQHYKYDTSKMNDAQLFDKGFNRVYDTIEPEINFLHTEDVIHAIMDELQQEPYFSSKSFCSKVGQYLHKHHQGSGILKSAYEQQVPVYIPAFTDSELALDIATHFMRQTDTLGSNFNPDTLPCQFNPFLDLFSYTKRITQAKSLGIFTIGGGVPRNWAQQVGPFVEIAAQRMPELGLNIRRFKYGVRICPEPVHWGGLSGCTYQEGISWGKFVPPEQGGKFAEVMCDATIAWPLLVKALQDRL